MKPVCVLTVSLPMESKPYTRAACSVRLIARLIVDWRKIPITLIDLGRARTAGVCRRELRRRAKSGAPALGGSIPRYNSPAPPLVLVSGHGGTRAGPTHPQ